MTNYRFSLFLPSMIDYIHVQLLFVSFIVFIITLFNNQDRFILVNRSEHPCVILCGTFVHNNVLFSS